MKLSKLRVLFSRWCFVATCVLVPLSIGATSREEAAETASNAEVMRSGMLGYGLTGNQSVYWIDDDRVLFIGSRPGDVQNLVDGRRPLRRSLIEWNVRTGSILKRAELPGEFQELCYDHGYVRYHYKAAGRLTVRAGILGRETEIPAKPSSRDDQRIWVNRFTCREYDQSAVQSRFGEGFIPLRDGDGYFGGRADARKQGKAVYVSIVDGREREILVPILGGSPRWSDYARGYIFKRTEDLFSATGTTGKMWLLRPGGETQEFAIPSGPWFRGSTGYGISAAGVLMWSHATVARAAGIYLLADARPRRLVKGYIYSFDVSQNGCRVAMSINLDDKSANDNAEIAMIDVCRKGS